MNARFAALCGLFAIASVSMAGTVIIMPDSTNNRLVMFSSFDGSVLNPNMFALQAGTPLHALPVGNEIWVSEQIGDRVSRWAPDGTLLGNISGGLDNIRGMALIGGIVYVTNDGAGNGAVADTLVKYDANGNFLGRIVVNPGVTSPFGILDYRGNMLVSSSNSNDDIHQFALDGTSLGTYHNTATISFAEQMAYDKNGDILVACFSSNNVVRLAAATGVTIGSFAAPGARGVIQLDNGNILWTSGTGAHVFDSNTLTSSQVYTGGGRYLELWNQPDSVRITGSIQFSARTAGFPANATIEFRNPGDLSLVHSAAAALTATANPEVFEYALTGTSLPPTAGSYVMSVFQGPWLRKNIGPIDTGSSQTGQDFVLVTGDINHDNVVNLDDFLVLAATYEVSPPVSPEADITGDGQVNLDDFLALAANYEVGGDLPNP